MKAMKAPPSELGAGLMVYLTRTQREQLREVLRHEGIYSASGWLRQVVVKKLRESADEDHRDDAA